MTSRASSTRRVRPAWPMRFAAGVTHSLWLGWRASVQGVIDFYNSDNLTYAASIAYYALVSLFPFLLLVLAILSKLTVGKEDVTLIQVITAALPRNFDFLVIQVQEMARAPLNLGLAGTAVMLFASMGLFGAITTAVNYAWSVEQPHGFLQHKMIAFVMLLAAGVLMLVALMLAGAVHVAETSWFAGMVAHYPILSALQGFVVRNAPTPMFILVVGVIYYAVPNAKVRLRDVWCGALVAGLLWRLALAGFSWYVSDLSRFSVHGSVAAVVVFLIWVYVSAVILLYGAEVSAAYARLRKHLPQTAPAAEVRA